MYLPSPLTLLGRLQDSVPQFLRPVEFRVVHDAHELKSALGLVYREYLKRSYTKPNPAHMKLSIYQALPSTATFVAVHRRAGIIGTMSLIVDSPLGLPMDEAYKSDLDRLRANGSRLAEATMLALNTDLFGGGVFTMFHAKKLLLTLRLFKVMFDYLRACTDVQELVACFNPKHQILYDFLQLKPLGGLKSYTSANGNPAIAGHLNIAQTQHQATTHVAYRLFYGKTPSPRAFARKLVLSPEELRELFVDTLPLFASASPTELRHIQGCYPTYSFHHILRGTPALSSLYLP